MGGVVGGWKGVTTRWIEVTTRWIRGHDAERRATLADGLRNGGEAGVGGLQRRGVLANGAFIFDQQ